MRDERRLKDALENGLSGLRVTPWQAHRLAGVIAAEDGGMPRRRAVPAWLVGLGVALATALWPLTAASELLL